MSACCVAVLAGVALASATAVAGESAGKRVGFAVLAGAETEPASGSAVESLRADLAARGLVPVPDGELRAALEAPLPPGAGDSTGGGDADAVARARQRLGAAKDAYAAFEYERALTELEAIDRSILAREPSPAVVALMVQRHLLAGLVHEGRGRPADARRSFRLVHRLDPRRRALDPGRYRPHVVALFAQAAARVDDPSSPLRIATEPAGARLWLDGRALSASPVRLDPITSGPHWVVASAPGRRPRGAIVDLDPAERRPTHLSFALQRRGAAERAAELRRALAAADGAGELRAGAAALARAAGLDLLVLVRAQDGRLEGASFDARTSQLSPWLAMPSERLSRRLAAAAADAGGARAGDGGAPPIVLSGRGAAPPADRRTRSWYRTWWGQTLLVAGGVALGGVLVYAATSGGDPGYSVGGFCFSGRDC